MYVPLARSIMDCLYVDYLFFCQYLVRKRRMTDKSIKYGVDNFHHLRRVGDKDDVGNFPKQI